MRTSSDIIFKKLFTTDEELLKSFLEDILEYPKGEIKNLVVKNPEILPEALDEKLSCLDLNLVVDKAKVNVEIQLCNEGNFRERSLYYWSKLYCDDLKKHEDYSFLRKSICVNILNFNLFTEKENQDQPYSKFMLLEESRHQLLTDKCAIYFFELQKLDSKIDKNDRKKLWLQFIDAETKEELDMLEKTEVPEIKKAVVMVKDMSRDTKLKEMARIREKSILDYNSAMKYSKNEGIAIGEKRGIEIGEKRGEKRGEEKGRNEIIDKLRKNGFTDEQIQNMLK